MAHDAPERDGEREFFFPRHSPPVTVRARTREEAERKLEEIDNPKEV